MVRTLDFHSKNVGSIPASLILYLRAFSNLKKFKNFTQNKTQSVSQKQLINYQLTFRSIIPPRSNVNLQLMTMSIPDENDIRPKRLLIKNSYILLSWLFFLLKTNQNFTKDTNISKVIPKFSIKPFRQSKFTITKAPMAHKTFSQEQYMYSYYSLSTNFKFYINTRGKNLNLNQLLFFFLVLKQSRFSFETNLFFLQKIIVSTVAKDEQFLVIL